jgi:hypothetical protein
VQCPIWKAFLKLNGLESEEYSDLRMGHKLAISGMLKRLLARMAKLNCKSMERKSEVKNIDEMMELRARRRCAGSDCFS